ncbi:MAG: hypothetical protein AB8H47_20925, partial [Bacteroidia bacterium]
YQAFYTERDSILSLEAPEQELAFRERALSYISNNPGRFVYRVWQRFKVFWAFDTFTAGTLLECNRPLVFAMGVQIWECLCYGLLWAALFWGVWQSTVLPLRDQKADINFQAVAAQNLAPLSWPLLYMLPYLLAFAHPTYHLPLLPLLVVMIPKLGGGVRLSRTLKKITWHQTIWSFCALIWCYIQIEWAMALLA